MNKVICSFLTILALVLFSTSAFARTGNFTWKANPETTLAGYKIYQVEDSVYTEVISVGLVTSVSVAIPDGPACYVILAFDMWDFTSGYSNEACTGPIPLSTPVGLNLVIDVN